MGGSHRADSTQEPGHGHGHGHGAEVELEVAPLPRAVLLAVLAAVAVAAVAGVVLLWPDSGKVDDLKGSVGFAVEGATFPTATVDEVLPACPRAGPDERARHVQALRPGQGDRRRGRGQGHEGDRRRAARGE